ncbi:hypothetical protein [Alteromonas lipotrueiana]|nr:hypothetical protein [Alteromonas lipotrueiana]
MTLISYNSLMNEIKRAESLLGSLPYWKISERLRLELRVKQMKSLLEK